MNGNVLHLLDRDIGESEMEVVRVPEGWSLQIVGVPVPLEGDPGGCITITLSVEDMQAMLAHMLATEATRG